MREMILAPTRRTCNWSLKILGLAASDAVRACVQNDKCFSVL